MVNKIKIGAKRQKQSSRAESQRERESRESEKEGSTEGAIIT